MMGYGWGMGFVGWVFMAFFWILLLGVGGWVVWASTAVRSGVGMTRKPRETPEEVLAGRFARGEMDTEEYRRAREELAAARSPVRHATNGSP